MGQNLGEIGTWWVCLCAYIGMNTHSFEPRNLLLEVAGLRRLDRRKTDVDRGLQRIKAALIEPIF